MFSDLENKLINDWQRLDDSEFVQIIEQLSGTGDVNRYIDGWALLHYAVAKSSILAVRYLLSNENIQLDKLAENSDDIVNIAIQYKSNLDVFLLLIPNTPDIKLLQIRSWLIMVAENERLEIFHWLFEFFYDRFGTQGLAQVSKHPLVCNIYRKLASSKREALYNAIGDNNLSFLQQLCETQSILNYDCDGKTLLQDILQYALENKKLEMLAYLVVRNNSDVPALENLNDLEKAELQNYLSKYQQHFPEHILSFLCAKTKVISWKSGDIETERIRNIYKKLSINTDGYNQYISPILNILHADSETLIVIDPNKTEISRINNDAANGVRGNCSPGKKIIEVAAGEARSNNEIAGTCIHEFCHMVCELIWNNERNPYFPNSKKQDVFSKICLRIKEQDKTRTPKIITEIFDRYDAPKYERELIVRVPQILVENKERDIQLLKANCADLVDFYEKYFLSMCQQYLQAPAEFLLKRHYSKHARVSLLFDKTKQLPIDKFPVRLMYNSNTQEEAVEYISFELPDLIMKHSKILITGYAGMGKSTLCQYLLNYWKTNVKFNEQFKWMFIIPLRNLNSVHYPECAQGYDEFNILEKECLPNISIAQFRKEIEDAVYNDQNILWILDGYDELSEQVPKSLEQVKNRLLRKQHVVITSRPQNIESITPGLTLRANGFSNNTIAQYIDWFFSSMPDKAFGLKDFLDISTIFNNANVPVNLELICNMWAENQTALINAGYLTETTLYSQMMLLMLRRFLVKEGTNPNALLDEKRILRRLSAEIQILERLSFKFMEQTTNEILSDELEMLEDNDLIMDLKNIGFATISLENIKDLRCINCEFIHLSFQEYFAARFLQNLFIQQPEEAKHFVKQYKYQAKYRQMLKFTAGLLYLQGSQQKPQKFILLNQFWQAILDEPQDLVGFKQMALEMHCLDECLADQKVQAHKIILQRQKKWLEFFLKQQTFMNYDYLSLLQQCKKVILTEEFRKTLVKLPNGMMFKDTFLETLVTLPKYHAEISECIVQCYQTVKSDFEKIKYLRMLINVPQHQSMVCIELNKLAVNSEIVGEIALNILAGIKQLPANVHIQLQELIENTENIKPKIKQRVFHFLINTSKIQINLEQNGPFKIEGLKYCMYIEQYQKKAYKQLKQIIEHNPTYCFTMNDLIIFLQDPKLPQFASNIYEDLVLWIVNNISIKDKDNSSMRTALDILKTNNVIISAKDCQKLLELLQYDNGSEIDIYDKIAICEICINCPEHREKAYRQLLELMKCRITTVLDILCKDPQLPEFVYVLLEEWLSKFNAYPSKYHRDQVECKIMGILCKSEKYATNFCNQLLLRSVNKFVNGYSIIGDGLAVLSMATELPEKTYQILVQYVNDPIMVDSVVEMIFSSLLNAIELPGIVYEELLRFVNNFSFPQEIKHLNWVHIIKAIEILGKQIQPDVVVYQKLWQMVVNKTISEYTRKHALDLLLELANKSNFSLQAEDQFDTDAFASTCVAIDGSLVKTWVIIQGEKQLVINSKINIPLSSKKIFKIKQSFQKMQTKKGMPCFELYNVKADESNVVTVKQPAQFEVQQINIAGANEDIKILSKEQIDKSSILNEEINNLKREISNCEDINERQSLVKILEEKTKEMNKTQCDCDKRKVLPLIDGRERLSTNALASIPSLGMVSKKPSMVKPNMAISKKGPIFNEPIIFSDVIAVGALKAQMKTSRYVIHPVVDITNKQLMQELITLIHILNGEKEKNPSNTDVYENCIVNTMQCMDWLQQTHNIDIEKIRLVIQDVLNKLGLEVRKELENFRKLQQSNSKYSASASAFKK